MFTVSVVTFLVEKDRRDKPMKICLGLKKKGYSQGKWNGFGGKVEPGEGLEEAAAREVLEESGLKIETSDLQKRAQLKYFEPGGNWLVHVFFCSRWQGELKESEEMKPQWFSLAKLPLTKMWENDSLWLPKLLATDKFITGTIWHDKNDKVIKQELKY